MNVLIKVDKVHKFVGQIMGLCEQQNARALPAQQRFTFDRNEMLI